MSVVKTYSHENPQPLTDENLNSLYASVGNHEGKAVLLGNMQSGTDYTLTSLHDLVMSPQGSNPVSVGANTNPYRWVRHSIQPNGLLVEEHQEHRKYQLSDFGYGEGQPFVGHQLELSANLPEGVGLRALLGMTKTRNGKGTTPPIDRLNIYKIVVQQSQSSLNDLDDKLEIPRGTIVNNLKWMEDNGLIEYNSINFKTQDEITNYEVVNDFNLYANGGSMREAVFGTIIAFQQDGIKSFSKLEFIGALDRMYPDKEIAHAKSRKSALRIIRELVEEDHLKQEVDQTVVRPEIMLIPDKRKVIEDILEIADGVKNGHQDFRDEGRAKLEAVLANKEAIRYLIEKAMKASPEANSKSLMERTREIEDCLMNTGMATISEISDQLAEKGITKSAIRETLSQLRSKGRVVSQTAHGEHLWTLAISDA